ncbi:MAG: TIGR03088 family PEP-CTERM/XrtA system glycosyltransferase [Betaproteobacteria bacterium]
MNGARPLHVVHMLYRFAAGGMENVLVQLINHLPRDHYRHTVVALTEADAGFAARIERDDVEVIALHKPPGQAFALYPTVFRLFRRLKPDVLHSCNLAALEFAPVAAMAGVPHRVHAEHGWDVGDPDGSNRRYRFLRRLYRPFVNHFVAVSVQLRDYLRDHIGVAARRLHLIPNGVDTACFRPRRKGEAPPQGYPFSHDEHWVIGTVGRLEPIKNQMLLAEAFVRLVERLGPAGAPLRLAIIGEGPLAVPVRRRLEEAGLGDRLWLPGTRNDIPEVLRAIDCFVLPSLAEGTSCTLQEAMATSIPIIATDVGGNRQLLGEGAYGVLVPSGDPERLSNILAGMFARRAEASPVPAAARQCVEREYAVEVVMQRYRTLFEER